MNLHPTILAHAAFLVMPRCRKELESAVGLIEEKFSVLKERQNTEPAVAISSGATLTFGSRSRLFRRIPILIDVGILDIWVMLDVSVDRGFAVGKRAGARRSPDHRPATLNAFRKTAAVPPSTLL